MNTCQKISLGSLIIAGCLFCLAAYINVGILGLLVTAGVSASILSLIFFLEDYSA